MVSPIVVIMSLFLSFSLQCNVVVSYPEHVCVVDGGSLVNVIKTYVENKSTGIIIVMNCNVRNPIYNIAIYHNIGFQMRIVVT